MADCRVGFVGAGGVASRHARHLAEIPGIRIAAVTDPAPGAVQLFAQATGAVAVPDVHAVLDAGVDAVYVCVPPHAHGPPEQAVIDAGIALFVEKPLGLDLATAARIAELVRKRAAITAVGHHWRYSTAVPLVQDLLDGHPVRLAVGSWIDKVPPVKWWAYREKSGGQMVEQAVHVLDLIRLLCGEVGDVTAYANSTPPAEGDVDVATAAVLRLRSGAVGTIAATCCLDRKRSAGLDLHADNLSVTIGEDAVTVHTPNGPQRHGVNPDQAKRAADQAFIDAVLGRGQVLVDYREALRTHELACAIATSAREQRAVSLHA
jgi:predicted dehydrogenase